MKLLTIQEAFLDISNNTKGYWKWPFELLIQNNCCFVSHSILFDSLYQAPQFMGFSRQEYWSGLPCPPRPLTHTPNFKKCQPPEVFFSRKGRHKLTLARLFIYYSWSFRHPSSCNDIYFPCSCDKTLHRLWIPFSFHPCLSVMSARIE